MPNSIKSPTALTLRVATANLNNCGDWSHPKKIEHFIHALIYELNFPHVIALQEIGGTTTAPNQPVVATVGREITQKILQRSGAHYQYLEIPPLPQSTGGAEDANIRSAFLLLKEGPKPSLSTFPPMPLTLNILEISTLGEDCPAFKGDSIEGTKPSRKPLLLHLMINNGEQKRELQLINCHLKSKNSSSRDEERLAKRQRNSQAHSIIKALKERGREIPTIILGDFNDTPNSDTLRILQSTGLTSLWKDYKGRIYTLKHRNQPIVLDYILYSPELLPSNEKICHINTYLGNEKRFSDHDPVVTEFTLL